MNNQSQSNLLPSNVLQPPQLQQTQLQPPQLQQTQLQPPQLQQTQSLNNNNTGKDSTNIKGKYVNKRNIFICIATIFTVIYVYKKFMVKTKKQRVSFNDNIEYFPNPNQYLPEQEYQQTQNQHILDHDIEQTQQYQYHQQQQAHQQPRHQQQHYQQPQVPQIQHHQQAQVPQIQHHQQAPQQSLVQEPIQQYTPQQSDTIIDRIPKLQPIKKKYVELPQTIPENEEVL